MRPKPVFPHAETSPRLQWPDRQVVAACLSGDSCAWDVLIERYASLIYTVLGRAGIAGADADDLFQEVCVLLLNHLRDLRDTDFLPGWLMTTTRRLAWRFRKTHPPLPLSKMSEESLSSEDVLGLHPLGETMPDRVLLALEERYLVRQALRQLPERGAQLLSLLYFEDPPCSYEEAAQRLGIPVGSIGPLRARYLKRLRKILDPSAS